MLKTIKPCAKISAAYNKPTTYEKRIIMKLVVVILNKTECLDNLLETLKSNNLHGATILDSKGMIQELFDNSNDYRIIGSLRSLFTPEHSENKTLLMVANDDEVEMISRVVNEATGGLDKPDTGILFTVPIDHLEGMSH